MDDLPKPSITIVTMSSDGVTHAFGGTGVRVVVGKDLWAAIDFDFWFGNAPVTITVAGRNKDGRGLHVPDVVMRPEAGNVVTVSLEGQEEISPAVLEVVSVNGADLKGGIRDWLRKTTSGDPLGEVTLAREDCVHLTDQSLLISYGDRATIKVDLIRIPRALLGIRISCHDVRDAPPKPGDRFQSMSMQCSFGGSNLVRFWFHEVTAFIPGNSA